MIRIAGVHTCFLNSPDEHTGQAPTPSKKHQLPTLYLTLCSIIQLLLKPFFRQPRSCLRTFSARPLWRKLWLRLSSPALFVTVATYISVITCCRIPSAAKPVNPQALIDGNWKTPCWSGTTPRNCCAAPEPGSMFKYTADCTIWRMQ